MFVPIFLVQNLDIPLKGKFMRINYKNKPKGQIMIGLSKENLP